MIRHLDRDSQPFIFPFNVSLTSVSAQVSTIGMFGLIFSALSEIQKPTMVFLVNAVSSYPSHLRSRQSYPFAKLFVRWADGSTCRRGIVDVCENAKTRSDCISLSYSV